MLLLSVFPISAAAAEKESSFKVSYLSASPDELEDFEDSDNPLGCDDATPDETESTEPCTVPCCPTEEDTIGGGGGVEPGEETEPTEPCTQPCTQPASEPVEIPATEAPTQTPTWNPIPNTEATEATKPVPTAAPTSSKPVESLSNNKPRMNLLAGTMRAGKTLVLTVYNTKGYKVKFSSSNKKIAKVSSKGLVTTLRKGFAKITAKVHGYKCYFTLKVVTNPTLRKTYVRIKKGRTLKVYISDKAPGTKLKFKNKKKAKIISSNTKSYIKVKAKKRGKTTLKVRVNGKWLSLKVKII